MWRNLTFHIFVIHAICFGILGSVSAGKLKKPAKCDKDATFFKQRTEYQYRYTATTSSSFVGTTDASSGSQFSCLLTLSVPKKCEIVMQLSECGLQERSGPGVNDYTDVVGTTVFTQELERYSVYFHMNEGLVVEESIAVHDDEPVYVRNIKRGILTALQLRIQDDYDEPVKEKTVFGVCPTRYTFPENKRKTVTTYRNLRECNLVQIFQKQLTNIGSFVKQLSGGYSEEPITESFYPFVSESTCHYRLNNQKRMQSVSCLQQQYFYPLAKKVDVLATAMANISQTLELQSTKRIKRRNLDLDSDGKSTIDLSFEFEPEETDQTDEADIADLLDKLADGLEPDKFDKGPELFAELTLLFRQATHFVLRSIMDDVFSCQPECTEASKAAQRFYLNGLESCGTDICIQMFFHCLGEGHVGRYQENIFLYSLAFFNKVSEGVLQKMLEYCKSSGHTRCWLPLGTLLGKTDIEEGDASKTDDALAMVLSDAHQKLTEHCNSEQGTLSHRNFTRWTKVLVNIGTHVLDWKMFKGISFGKSITDLSVTCLQNPNLPTTMKRDAMMAINSQTKIPTYDVSQYVGQMFVFLDDVTMDTTLRYLAFEFLAMIPDKTVIQGVAARLDKPDNQQIRAYMTSYIRTMLENDQPDRKTNRAIWEEVFREENFSLYPDIARPYSLGMSKTINIANFFKFPVTEYMGGQLWMDLVYDPSAVLFSTFRVNVNYFYDGKKYNMFEVTVNAYGLDEVLKAVSGSRQGRGIFELYATYLKLQAQEKAGGAQDERTFTKFQQDIISAVVDILEQVNHPKLNHLDLSIHLKLQGENVNFLSVKDLFEYAQMAKQHGAPDQLPWSQRILAKLVEGIHSTTSRAMELASIVKKLPTCAGVPLNMKVQVAGMAFYDTRLSVNVMEYMRQVGPVVASFKDTHRASLMLSGELVIPIGSYHSSGIRFMGNAGVGSNTDLGLTFGHHMDAESGRPYTALQLDIKPVKGDEKTIMHSSGKMYLLHHSGKVTITNDPAAETSYQKCSPAPVATVLGHSLCVTWSYATSLPGQARASFPLSGPFDRRITLRKDDTDMEIVTLKWTYDVMETDEGHAVQHMNFTHLGKGAVYDRLVTMNVVVNKALRTVEIHAAIPEVEFEYKFKLARSVDPETGVRTFEISEFSWLKNKPYVGYYIKGKSSSHTTAGMYNHSREYHLNLTLPGISWDIQVGRSDERPSSGIGQHTSNKHLRLAYYCSPERPVLYVLHVHPATVAEDGHTSRLDIEAISHNNVLSTNPPSGNGDRSVTIELPGQKITYTLTHEYTKNDKRNSILTYLDFDGVERRVVMTGNIVNNGNDESMDYDLNANLDSDVFNAVVTGSLKGHPKDLQASFDVDYTRNDENESARKKRSMQSIYSRFVQVEQAAAKKISQLKESIMGKSETPSEPNAYPPADTDIQYAETGTQVATPEGAHSSHPHPPQLPPLPMFPSIWDIEAWHADVTFTLAARPVFPAEGGAVPEGVEFVHTLEYSHPWYGGYKRFSKTGRHGKSMKSSYGNFKYWSESSSNTTYTTLDGTAITLPGYPAVIPHTAEFYLERVAGHKFEFRVNRNCPVFKMKYDILFDWDAVGHHKPLGRVDSSMDNLILPILNHKYTEVMSLSEDSMMMKHCAKFDHKLLSFHVHTDATRGETGVQIHQNGSVALSLSILNIGYGYEFTNEFWMKHHELPVISISVVPESTPEKALIYDISFLHPRAVQIKGGVKPSNMSTVSLFTVLYERLGSSIGQVTFSWEPVMDPAMQARFHRGVAMKLGTVLTALGKQLHANADKALMDKTIPFTRLTPKAIVGKFVAPKIIRGMGNAMTFGANFVPLKVRRAIMDQPGPKLPPKFAQFMGVVMKMRKEKKEPCPVTSAILHAKAYAVQTVGQLSLLLGSYQAKHPKIAAILEKRQFVYAWTALVVIPSFMQKPRLKESTKQMNGPIEDALKYHRYKYQYKVSPSVVKMAAVFGRHESGRPLNVLTFDGFMYKIPGVSADACTYLLMADTARRNYAVVLSPSGVSLITRNASVTVGYDNTVYANDCKEPLDQDASMQFGDIFARRQDDKVSLETSYGLQITCYTLASDVCIFSLAGSHVNDTVGLLGTNNDDKHTDMLKPDGTYATDIPGFLASYMLSGPASCRASPPPAPEKGVCNEELHHYCYEMFNSLQSQTGWCSHFINTAPFMDVCRREAQRCDSLEQDVCHSYTAYTAMCQGRGLADSLPDPPVPCKELPVMNDGITSSLDVVYVISEHEGMDKLQHRGPWEHMFELVAGQRPELYSDVRVRVGVVGFAGQDPAARPILLGEQQDKFFEERSVLDYSPIEGLSAVGTGPGDAFDAIKVAADYPFNPTAHKMIVVMMIKKQGTGVAEDLDTLKAKLQERGIILNVFSTYRKLASRKVIGVDWQENVINVNQKSDDVKKLPQNDYTKLVRATHGALFDVMAIVRGRNAHIARILQHFSQQIKDTNSATCPAA